MPSSYPGSIDNLTNPTPTSATSNPSHADQHEDENDAIEAIETELGTTPSGAAATVAARFTADEAALAAHLADTADAHDASAISILDTAADFTATDVEGALAELQSDAETAAVASAAHAALARHASSFGTSNPAQPAYGNDVPFYRSDLDLWIFYNGTRWLSITLFRESFGPGKGANPYAASNNESGVNTPWAADHDLWLETFYASTYVATTNTGSAFWDVRMRKHSTAFAGTTLATISTSAQAPDVLVPAEAAIGALLTPATYPLLVFDVVKTSTPGNLTVAAGFTYRLVTP